MGSHSQHNMEREMPVDQTRSYLAQYLEWKDKQDLEALFKDSMNRVRTNSMFLELYHLSNDGAKPIFTNKERHCNGCWSFPLLYSELGDVTEYQVGQTLLYNYDHFCKLAASQNFRKMINSLRDNLERKVRAEALQVIRTLSKEGKESTALAAARFLAKREWIEDKKQKDAILRDQMFAEKTEDEFEEDFKKLVGDTAVTG